MSELIEKFPPHTVLCQFFRMLFIFWFYSTFCYCCILLMFNIPYFNPLALSLWRVLFFFIHLFLLYSHCWTMHMKLSMFKLWNFQIGERTRKRRGKREKTKNCQVFICVFALSIESDTTTILERFFCLFPPLCFSLSLSLSRAESPLFGGEIFSLSSCLVFFTILLYTKLT